METPISRCSTIWNQSKFFTLTKASVKFTTIIVGASSIALLAGKSASAAGLQFSGSFDGSGNGNGGFSYVGNVAVDGSGNVYVTK